MLFSRTKFNHERSTDPNIVLIKISKNWFFGKGLSTVINSATEVLITIEKLNKDLVKG